MSRIYNPKFCLPAGEVIATLENKSFRIVNLKLLRLTSDEVKSLSENHTDFSSIPRLLSELSGRIVIALELMGANACELLNEFIYGSKGDDVLSNPDLFMLTTNASDSLKQANKIFGYPGGMNYLGAPLLKNTTLSIIRPHAVSDGLTGKIWNAIKEKGFCVTAARLYRLSKADAAEFLEVYKGVVQEYPEMLDQLSSGPCIALEIGFPDPNVNVHQTFREFTGPIDPEIAKFLRPDTLRAVFGVDKVRNAVHCTDLPGDTELEVSEAKLLKYSFFQNRLSQCI
uniref:Nucleoside diphosphate kinase-like domain-containing protein n=1 Tax=Trichobilharzia regenti TaxID=157069 RepID=A0AA85JFR3_TRIRE|nr:unnamed protein product [Trichobilharzia regenti]